MPGFLLLLLFCFFIVPGFTSEAQVVADSVSVEQVKVWDEGMVNYRTPPYEQIEQWKTEYVYEQFEGPGFWDYLFARVFYWLGSFVEGRPWFFYVLLVLAGLLVLYLLLRLLDVPVAGVFVVSNQKTESHLRFVEDTHDYSAPKLRQMLQMFRDNKAWREAVRMMFLLYLRELDESGEITIKPFKTNQEYYREISDPKNQGVFRKRKRLFEVVWYGHVELDADQFDQIEAVFGIETGKEGPGYD